MKLALLGADEESLLLADAAVRLGHEIVWWGDLAESLQGPRPCLPDSNLVVQDQADQWEVLLDTQMAEGVIVGRGATAADHRAVQVGELVKNGVAVLATFPLVESVLAYYEIDMARGESGALLQHFNPLTAHQAVVEQAAQWTEQGHPQLGAIEQIAWERPMGQRTQERVLYHFARDVELLQRVAGRLNRLAALGSPDEQSTYAGLSVQMLGESQRPVRWSIGPTEQAAGPRLTLVAERGRLTIQFDQAQRPTQLEINLPDSSQSTPLECVDEADVCIRRFAAALTHSPAEHSTWPEALRAMELTDTIEISLRRGRMIDVYPQQLTEQLAFKGTMAAAGCGVLLVLPPLLLAVGWIAEQMGVPVARRFYWAHGLLALLTAFLALQLLPKLLYRSRQPDDPSSDDS